MKYKTKVQMEKAEFDRWNFLLSKDLNDMTEEEKQKYDAKEDDMIPGFDISFDDGARLTIDLCSGNQNYFENTVIYDIYESKYVFDPLFTIDIVNEFYTEHDTYILEIEII